MDFRSTTARAFLLAAVLSLATAGCGKRGNGDEAAAGGGSGSASSGSSSSGASGAAGAGSTGSAGMSGSSGAGTSGTSGTSGSSGSAGGAASTAGAAIDDSIITTKLKTALLADTTLKGSDISVETRGGEVSLSGTVTSPAQKDHAAKIAQALNGVKNVNNKLVLKK